MTGRIGLFLDTSILYSLRLKYPVLSRHIQEICHPSHVFTGASVYSLLEFDQRVIGDAEYICRKIEEMGYDAAKEWTNDVLPPPQSRKRTTCHSLFSLMDSQWRNIAMRLSGIGMSQLPDMDRWAVDWLKHFGKTELDVLKKFINHWNDGIGCRSAAEVESRRRKGGKRTPIKCDSASCRLLEFLETNRDNLWKVSNVIRALPEDEKTSELERILQFIRDWQEKPGQVFKREKGCRLIGDLLIALESGTFETIYTQNKKEFIPLGKALEKIIWNQSNQAEEPSVHHYRA